MMRWKTVLCLTITITIAASVHITIDNDLHVHDQDTDTTSTSTTLTTEGYSTTSTTLGYVGVTVPEVSTITTTEQYSTTVTTTTEITTTVAHTTTTDSHGDIDVGSEESMTEVPDSQEITNPGDNNQPESVPGSRSIEAGNREHLIQTTNGPVQGFEWNLNSGIIAYIDVPYGKFTRYFQDPTHPEPWEKIHDVKEHNKRCPQLQDDSYVGDLDCLTLSIFTPTNTEKAGVLFYIHESNFISGSGDPSVYGPEYFINKGVILILPNYRLGPPGFLCLRNATAPGNIALKDLTLALNWTMDNIAAFGGDPSNIVVSGDGTSGALAEYLALSPRSKHYISKVITESGSMLSHWALDRNPTVPMEKLIKNIRDLTFYNNTFESADIETIIKGSKNVVFRPCLEHSDNPFLSNTPWTLLYTTSTNVTFMIGAASHAGTQEAFTLSERYIEELNKDFGTFLPNDLQFQSLEEKSDVGSRIKTQYFGDQLITLEHVNEMSLCYTDSWYLGPAIRTARALVHAGAMVYFYEFGFVGKLNRELEYMKRPINGTVRGDIVGYLFTQDGEQVAENTEEKRMVNIMINLWVTFIETGHPKLDNIEWNGMCTSEDAQEQWLSIGTDVQLKRGIHMNRTQLWTEIYNKHFIENHNIAVPLLSNIYTAVILILFWFGLRKIHVFEQKIK